MSQTQNRFAKLVLDPPVWVVAALMFFVSGGWYHSEAEVPTHGLYVYPIVVAIAFASLSLLIVASRVSESGLKALTLDRLVGAIVVTACATMLACALTGLLYWKEVPLAASGLALVHLARRAIGNRASEQRLPAARLLDR